jgi:hypothetical protein
VDIHLAMRADCVILKVQPRQGHESGPVTRRQVPGYGDPQLADDPRLHDGMR